MNRSADEERIVKSATDEGRNTTKRLNPLNLLKISRLHRVGSGADLAKTES